MKKYIGLSFCALAVTAVANAETFVPEVGVSIGYTDHSFDVTGAGFAAVDADESDVGLSLFGSLMVHENVKIKLAYQDLGEFSSSIKDVNQTQAEASIDFDTTGLSLSILPYLQIDEQIGIYGEIGKFDWESDGATRSLSLINGVLSETGSASFSQDGTDTFYGGGMSYRVGDNMAAQAEFKKYDIDDNSINYLSVGISAIF